MAAFANDTLPDGWLACDGTSVSRTTYANLFSKIGTTYGSGDGSATFNLPNLTDKFIEGSSTSGTEHSAGLPNITGELVATNAGVFNGQLLQGSFSPGAAYPYVTEGRAGDGGYLQAHFDASRSNTIYGNSNTVQPPALTMRFSIFARHSGLFRWIRTV